MIFPINLLKTKLLCSELSLKDYKEILKITYGDEPSVPIFIETITSILSRLTNTDQSFFKELNIIELLIVLIELRIQSMGDAVTITLKEESANTSLELRLDWIKEDLLLVCNQFNDHTIQQNNFNITLSPPSIEKLLESTDEEYLYFIKKVLNKNNDQSIVTSNVNLAKMFFDKLSARTAANIIKYFENFVTTLKNSNFLSRYGIEKQILVFIPTIESLMWFVKLLFNESIDSFYDNIFYLSHYGHLNSSYIEQCTPGEYIYFTKKLQQVLNQQKGTEENETSFPADSNNLPEDLQDGYIENS
tara:strand:- start:180 stop:1088 length:909 start_codon:yes stop_codon:yes gene_type:complete